MKEFKILAITAAVFSLSFLCAFSFATEPSQDIEIMLDASGSMRGQIKGEAKITIAKSVLAELVDGLKTRQDVSLAVRVYGHQSPQQQKNCQDTKLEIPFGPPDGSKVSALIKQINAQGNTPIAYSLTQAKNDFDLGSKRKRAIVLITDGVESCNGDFCAAARELATSGIDVTLHVVGFDLQKGELEKLKCLTQPSKGLLLPARDADQLKGALGQVMSKALAQNLVLTIFDTNRNPVPAYARALKSGTEEYVSGGHGSRIAFGLPSGVYDIVIRSDVTNQTKKLSGLEVKEDVKTEKEVVFGNGRLTGVVKDVRGGPVPARVEVFEIKGTEERFVNARDNSVEKLVFDLPAGVYKMIFTNVRTHEKKPTENMTLEDGKEITKEFAFAEAKIKAAAKDMSGRSIKTHVTIMGVEGSQEKFLDAGYTGDEPKLFYVAPGTYRIIFLNEATGARKVTENITVVEGQETVKEIAF